MSVESCETSTAKALATASVIMAKKIAFTRSEKRPMTRASAGGKRRAGQPAEEDRAPARAHRVERDRHAIGADAEEHGVGEGDDAGIAKQQVVARDQHDEDADARGRLQAARAGKEERRQRQPDEDRDEHDRQRQAARAVAGDEADQHGLRSLTSP